MKRIFTAACRVIAMPIATLAAITFRHERGAESPVWAEYVGAALRHVSTNGHDLFAVVDLRQPQHA